MLNYINFCLKVPLCVWMYIMCYSTQRYWVTRKCGILLSMRSDFFPEDFCWPSHILKCISFMDHHFSAAITLYVCHGLRYMSHVRHLHYITYHNEQRKGSSMQHKHTENYSWILYLYINVYIYIYIYIYVYIYIYIYIYIQKYIYIYI
jgi:hypothetical protein